MGGVWIRTQNKETLVFVSFISRLCHRLQGSGINESERPNLHCSVNLGEYQSKNRAFEILDEIQKHIQSGNNGVYIMPKE